MSHFLRWSCCAPICLLALGLGSWESAASGQQVAFHQNRPRHQPIYDYVPPDMDYGGQMGCGPECDTYGGGCERLRPRWRLWPM